MNPEETVDLSHNRPTSSDIYAVPSDTLTAGIAKDQGKYEDHGYVNLYIYIPLK